MYQSQQAFGYDPSYFPYRKTRSQKGRRQDNNGETYIQPNNPSPYAQLNSYEKEKIEQETLVEINQQKTQSDSAMTKRIIQKLIADVGKNDKEKYLEQLRRQIKQKFFTQKAIQKQMQQVAFRLFYYPSLQLAETIQSKIGIEAEIVIRNSVALRHGDLILLKQDIIQGVLKKEIDHVMDDLIAWGQYLFDLKKLQQMASQKFGNSEDRTYVIEQMGIEVRMTSSMIQVKYKKKQITPTQMKNSILRQMAIQRLKRKATVAFYEITKQKHIII